MPTVFLNNRLIPAHQARISIFDRGYLYGEGAFETLRTYDGVPAFVGLHYARLATNCVRLNIPLPLTETAFAAGLRRVVRANRLRDAALRVTVSLRGTAAMPRPAHLRSNVVIHARALPTWSADLHRQGASIIVVRAVVGDAPQMAQIKSTSYLSKMLAREEVRRAGAHEGLILTANGHVLEGTASNFFIIRQSKLWTTPLGYGALPGITRALTLLIARWLGIAAVERPLRLADIQNADELFLTGTTSEILPVREVRGHTRQAAAPGPLTKHLMAAYKTLIDHCR